MKKLILCAVAGSTLILGGCSKGEEAAPAGEATSEAAPAASEAATAAPSDGASSAAPNEPTGGGVHP